MKPYGLPRVIGAAGAGYSDLVDIGNYGLKSSASRIRSKSGDIRNSFRNPDVKRSRRRIYKSRERQEARREIVEIINEIDSEAHYVD